MYLILYSFLWTVYFGVVTSHKIFFSCVSTSSLSCFQIFFSEMKLVKTSLHTQLKQIHLGNPLPISTESFYCFQHFVDELKHCNPNMQMDLHSVSVFLCLYSIHLVVILPFITCFALFRLPVYFFLFVISNEMLLQQIICSCFI